MTLTKCYSLCSFSSDSSSLAITKEVIPRKEILLSTQRKEVPEVFSGTFKDCLKHFGDAMNKRFPKGSRGASRSRIPMAEFCGVGVSTTGDWLLRGSAPSGETWVKLLFFLSLQGYRIIELVRMRDDIRNFAELIAFGVITSQQAANDLGYTDTSRIYQLIHGVHRPLDDKAAKMYSIWKESREELEKKKASAQRRYFIDLSSEEEEANTQVPEADSSREVEARSSRSSRASSASPQVKLLLRLMAVLNQSLKEGNGDFHFPDLEPEDQQLVLRLSAQLNGLSAGIISGHSRNG